MNRRPDVLWLIVVAALVSYGCRTAGFLMMRYVPATPRVTAALKAAPLAVMVGIAVPFAMRGGPIEWAGILAAVLLARSGRGDFTAALGAMALVAIGRAFMT
jgi:uncharacterized membrane protein